MSLQRDTNHFLPFISKAPSENGLVGVRVEPMTAHHVDWWHFNIQKSINTMECYKHRADYGWHWPRILSLVSVTKYLGQQPYGFTLGLPMPNGDLLPCGLVLLVRYPYFVDHRKKAVFLWYLTDAPRSVLRNHLETHHPDMKDIELPKMLGSICLDIAVTHAFNTNLEGRMELHAAKEGGERLFQWYEKQGMTPVPESRRLPIGRQIGIGNDGRYFFFSSSDAIIFSEALNRFRAGNVKPLRRS